MADQIKSPVVNSTGKTRLRESLERAKRGEGPSVGQWLEFPGYSLARTVAPLGEDVSYRIFVDPESSGLSIGYLTESDYYDSGYWSTRSMETLTIETCISKSAPSRHQGCRQ